MIWRCADFEFDTKMPIVMGILNVTPDSFSDGGEHEDRDAALAHAERMVEDDGVTPYTAHTTNLVPFYIVGADVKLRDGRLADIAPTMLDLMGLEKPSEMDGKTLIAN